MALETPQSAISSLSSSARAHWAAVQVASPGIAVICLENLQVTNIAVSYPSLDLGSARMKLIVSVWKETGGVSIGFKDLYGRCRLVCST